MIEFKEAKGLKDYDSVTLAEMLRDRFTRTYPIAEVNRLTGAIQVASYLHRHDVRRGNRGKMPNPPYIEHPLRVALRLIGFEVSDPDVIIAAVLHDTVEDHAHEFSDFEGVLRTEITDEPLARRRALEFISQKFGYGVAALVDMVSNPILPSGISKAEKIESYLNHVGHVVGASELGRILKFSDFVDNGGSLHHHYNYNDPKVQYFLDRYSPLLIQYRRAFLLYDSDAYDLESVIHRLDMVQEQFSRFESGLARG